MKTDGIINWIETRKRLKSKSREKDCRHNRGHKCSILKHKDCIDCVFYREKER